MALGIVIVHRVLEPLGRPEVGQARDRQRQALAATRVAAGKGRPVPRGKRSGPGHRHLFAPHGGIRALVSKMLSTPLLAGALLTAIRSAIRSAMSDLFICFPLANSDLPIPQVRYGATSAYHKLSLLTITVWTNSPCVRNPLGRYPPQRCHRLHGPVFARDEGFDLGLALAHEAQCHRLHPSGRPALAVPAARLPRWVNRHPPRGFVPRSAGRYTKPRGSPLLTTGTTSAVPLRGRVDEVVTDPRPPVALRMRIAAHLPRRSGRGR